MEQGLALASGGARGAYQAGALLLMAERGVRFDSVAGTSIGALNGAFYVQGDGSAGHLEKLCHLWRAVPNAGIIQISGTTIARSAAMLAARGIPWPVRLGLNRLVGESISILDPGPVADMLDKWVDYAAVCSSPREFMIALLRENVFSGGVVTAPWREATYVSAAELGSDGIAGSVIGGRCHPVGLSFAGGGWKTVRRCRTLRPSPRIGIA